jgi:hypothetical protein
MWTHHLALLLTAVLQVPNTVQPPSDGYMTVTDYKAPPPSLEQTFVVAAIVARVASVGEQVRRKLPTRDGPSPVETVYTIRIVEVLKGSDRGVTQNMTLDITVPVGTLVDSQGRRQTANAPALAKITPGNEYVVFLESLPDGGYGPAYGPAGIFPLVGNSVSVPETARRWSVFGGQETASRAGFLTELRRLRTQSK